MQGRSPPVFLRCADLSPDKASAVIMALSIGVQRPQTCGMKVRSIPQGASTLPLPTIRANHLSLARAEAVALEGGMCSRMRRDEAKAERTAQSRRITGRSPPGEPGNIAVRHKLRAVGNRTSQSVRREDPNHPHPARGEVWTD